jgi:hypothetical protein
MNSGLSKKGHGHVAVSDMEIEGAGAVPSEGLVGVEEFFHMPPSRVLFDEGLNFIAILCRDKPSELVRLSGFPAPLDDLVEGGMIRFAELKWECGGRQSSPSMREGFRGEMAHSFALLGRVEHRR